MDNCSVSSVKFLIYGETQFKPWGIIPRIYIKFNFPSFDWRHAIFSKLLSGAKLIKLFLNMNCAHFVLIINIRYFCKFPFWSLHISVVLNLRGPRNAPLYLFKWLIPKNKQTNYYCPEVILTKKIERFDCCFCNRICWSYFCASAKISNVHAT